MNDIDRALQDLVIANRILAMEDVVDAYGHVSVRHPEQQNRYFLSRSLAPQLVDLGDIVEHDLRGEPVSSETRTLYLERYIHAAIFEARPDVQAIVHAHTEDVLPFTIASGTPLRPVIHSGSFMGDDAPVWDIAERFGETHLLVSDLPRGRDLARCLGAHQVVLMRGHGFVAAASSIIEVVRMSVFLPRNARALRRAGQLGGRISSLSHGEIAERAKGYGPGSPETWRTWQYWATKCGCGHLVTMRE